METFWTIAAYAFVFGTGAVGGLVFLLWMRAAADKVDARGHGRGTAKPPTSGQQELPVGMPVGAGGP